MKFLERILTKITMYTLVLYLLTGILSVAFLLSFFDVFAFSPLALAASGMVFGAVALISNYGFGKIFQTATNVQSGMITALLLTALLTPSLDPGVLVQYGFIALIAMASKYVLVYRGRHIFNPTALAVFVGGLIGLQYASWWIVTPPLFFLIAIAAFVTLYKTRDLRIGGVFIVTGIVVFLATQLFAGNALLGSLMVALTSWPFLFVGGFMLSEPLTLPPRTWQKLLVAAVAGLIIGLPFTIGTFHSSPEFALLIANLLAFLLAFRQRGGLVLTLKNRRKITPTTYEFIFSTPRAVQFLPGQYIELTIPHKKFDMRGFRRSFSVTSPPRNKELRLGIKFYSPSSTFKKALLQLGPEALVHTTGITGDFVLPRDRSIPLLLIAGGIGITPFISMLQSDETKGRDITLLYFVSTPEEAAYRTILDESGATVHYFAAYGGDHLFTEAAFLTDSILHDSVIKLRDRYAYISGPPAMVMNVKKLLKTKVRRIITDYFSGY